MNLPCHPVADIFPQMDGAEFDALVQSIRQHGLQQPILVWTDPESKTWIIDGRNRYRACQESGIVPRFEEWDGKGSLAGVVAARNLDRRHLTTSQRAMIAVKLLPFVRQEAQARMAAGKKTLDAIASRVSGKAEDVAGGLVGISGDSVQRAKAVIERGSEELQEAVRDGRVSVSRAADITELPPEEQAAVINRSERGSRMRRERDDRKDRINRADKKARSSRRDIIGLGGEADRAVGILDQFLSELSDLRAAG